MPITFIEDKEFDLSDKDNEDLLGTKPYAETLFEVIIGSTGKQNIGLFGGWGSGKSTIIRTLEKFIAINNEDKTKEKIAFFKYDAWKYAKDDFRRSFLKSLNSRFSIIDDKELERLLYKDVTIEDPTKSKVQISYEKIVPYIIGALLLFLGYILFLSKFSSSEKFALSLFSIFSGLIFSLSNNIFRVIPYTTRESKLIEAEKFEETFNSITKEIFGKKSLLRKLTDFVAGRKQYQKMVIVIDNLDRCDKENLMVTLSSVKNFLESENVTFVLPVDENGVTAFLDGNTDDVDEYLRKIFHQIIRLKKFTPRELVDFTNELNKKYSLGLSKTGIRLICQEFTTNPRKIIQFLNNLQTERDLIKRQIEQEYVKLEFNTQADDFLIKLLIIKQEWNHLYKMLLDDVNFLKKLNNALRNNEIEQKGNTFILRSGKEEFRLKRDEKRFFKRNRDVHFEYVEPFILNIDRNKDVPDELIVSIENGELERALELIGVDEKKGIQKKQVRVLLEQMEYVFDYNSNKFEDYNTIALPILEMLIGLFYLDPVKKEVKKNIRNYTFIKRIFSDPKFTRLLPNIVAFKELCNLTKWFYFDIEYEIPYNRLFTFLNRSIKPDTTVEGIHTKIKDFINTYKENPNLISGFQKHIESKVLDDPKLIYQYPTSSDDIEVATHLFSSKFIDKMLEKLNEGKIEDKKAKRRVISLTENYIDGKIVKDPLVITELANYYISRLSSEFNLKATKSKGIFELDSIITKVTYLLPKSDLDTIKVETTLFDNILQRFKQEYNTSLSKIEISKYINFFKMVLEYMFLDKDFSTNDNIAKYFTFFFLKSEYNELSLGINDQIYKREINHFGPNSWSFFESIIQKLKTHKRFTYVETLLLMLNKSTKEKGLTQPQKITLSDSVLGMFLNYCETTSSSLISSMTSWFIQLNKKDTDLMGGSVDKLDSSNLRKYVYNIHKLDKSENYIFNSFSKYLQSQNNYKSFEKFVRFVFENHTQNTQKYMLQDFFKAKKSYDWLFSSRKYIHKRVFNSLIDEYFHAYDGIKDNSNYLKNLLRLRRNDLYNSQKSNAIRLIENLERPTKSHRRKIKQIKSKI